MSPTNSVSAAAFGTIRRANHPRIGRHRDSAIFAAYRTGGPVGHRIREAGCAFTPHPDQCKSVTGSVTWVQSSRASSHCNSERSHPMPNHCTCSCRVPQVHLLSRESVSTNRHCSYVLDDPTGGSHCPNGTESYSKNASVQPPAAP